jgi:hypothetical protein
LLSRLGFSTPVTLLFADFHANGGRCFALVPSSFLFAPALFPFYMSLLSALSRQPSLPCQND